MMYFANAKKCGCEGCAYNIKQDDKQQPKKED